MNMPCIQSPKGITYPRKTFVLELIIHREGIKLNHPEPNQYPETFQQFRNVCVVGFRVLTSQNMSITLRTVSRHTIIDHLKKSFPHFEINQYII